MLGIRLIRRAQPLMLLGFLLLGCAAAVTGVLLLESLARAIAAPLGRGETALPDLLWCAVPLAAVGQLAAALARVVPGEQARAGLAAAGLGPAGLPVPVASATGVCCLAGSAVAALLQVRRTAGGVPGLPGGPELPLAAVLTLLCVAPALASAAAWLSARRALSSPRNSPGPLAPRHRAHASHPADMSPQSPAPSAPLWGAALGTAGLVLTAFAARAGASGGAGGGGVPGMQGLLGTAGVLAGWLALACGLVIAVPGIVHGCGNALASGQPGALRLLCGRALQQEAARLGRPLGLLCAVCAGTVAGVRLYGTAPEGVLGAHAAVALLVVPVCAAASALIAVDAVRAERAPVSRVLQGLGAPGGLLRRAAALRTAVLLAVLSPLAWLAGTLAAVPVPALP